MSTVALVLVVISAAMHAARNFLTKTALDKQAFVWLYELLGMLLFMPFLALFLYKNGFPPTGFLIFIVFSGLLHFLYWFFLTKSYDNGELSHVYPIMRSSPALVLLVSLTVLKEEITLLGFIGIILVAVGVYTINFKELSFSQVLEPLRAIRNERATQYAFLTLLSVTAYSIVDKLAVARMHPVIFAGLYPWLSMLFFTPYVFGLKGTSALRNEFAARKRSIVLCGFLGIFGYLLILIALSFERVSYVVGVRQLSVVFAVLLGTRVLDEGNRVIRLSASLIIFIGTLAIALAK